ncbi:hypothetical protein [Photorhabdus bodei]|uniref:Uncharacterized protein n=1 Tax=Photorhabdus bodei TaxID=2029681 RepID=A0ABX0ANS8_9GAMM|nr:hypothetical protein [Photorhabdus bodei]NDL00504.1 hypothetical protein [Photorhabdus bodei]NDL04638.1 hypothetical protein [Photorhabdus bodei]NDL08963.1 hypothetical protein [Photorhabdus bodei]
MTGVSERSQQRGNLKDNGYILDWVVDYIIIIVIQLQKEIVISKALHL